MKRFIVLIAIICLLLPACSSDDSKISEIKERGALRVGVKVDVPRFGMLNAGEDIPEGLEIDIAKVIAKDLLGDEESVVFVPVTALTRETMLDNNEVDLVIATFTITEERKERYNFSIPYYTDEIGFLVMKASNINSLSDANGTIFGVTMSSTAFTQLEENPHDLGITFELKGSASYPEVKNNLVNGVVSVFAADKSILYGYADENTLLLEEGINPQDYGIATRLDDKEFSKHIDELLQEMKDDGTLDSIINNWLK